MRIAAIESTDRFIASGQVVRVTLDAVESATRLYVRGPAVNTPEPVLVPPLAGGETYVAEVGVRPEAPYTAGSRRPVTAVAEAAGERVTADGEIVVADTGWTMWMISHFHYDPVWWNTQGGFTQAWYDLPAAEQRRPPVVATAFDLVHAHLDAARHDPDYKFVLAEVDYLKPYWDARPEDRADLRRFLAEGRVEIVGGNYNEPNTNLTHPESTIRNAAYGVAYQRDVVGGDPRTAWMLDVFGHDPAYPGLMADAGLTSSAWARGPFHMWGPRRHVGDNRRMQFPAEFEWISPNGRGLLTAYMANHYGAGWDVERASTAEEAAEIAYGQFAELSPVAATPNVLLPVGADHVVPSRWCTEIGRDWNKRYVWPRFVVGLPRDFFAAVRAELGERRPSPQTRDMNPVYTGKDVSYTDTKQAQRAAEVAVLDAERLATLAALRGARYPAEALDKAWRQLVFGAHHDAITGSESDQVYVDLLGGWREAYELGDTVRTAALNYLAGAATRSFRPSDLDQPAPGRPSGEGRPLIVANTLSWPRDGIATVRLAVESPGVRLVDDGGEPVPFVAEAAGDGEIVVTFLARRIPALGHRIYRVLDSTDPPPSWTSAPGVTAANAAFEVTADPARGGALTSIRDLRAGRELLRPGGLGGELTCQEEYDTHPTWGEGPWHLLPKGPGRGTGERPATVRLERCPIGSRLVTETALDELTVTAEVLLWDGVDRVDFRTRVDGSIGQDRLLRVRFDLDVPGARPVSEVGFAAIGRPFGFPDADTAEHLWTLDNPAHTWTALSATAKILLLDDDDGTRSSPASGTVSSRASGTVSSRASGTVSSRASGTTQAYAIGVAEVVADGEPRAVLAALAAQGVTATCTRPDGPRYGSLDVDSNLPDVRIALGGPGENAFTADVLAAAEPAYRDALAATGRVFVPAARPMSEVWTPGADLRGVRDLPVLIVADDPADLCADLADSAIEVARPAGLPAAFEAACDHSVAILNAGTPGTVAKLGEALYLNLMRSCSSWPSGVWIDGPLRPAPDGSSLSWQHWTHTFRYALAAGEGDWRSAGFVRAGQEFNHAVLAHPANALHGASEEGSPGFGPSAGPVSVEPENVLLSALKPAGEDVIVRVYESAGRPVTARIGLPDGVVRRTDVLESDGGEEVNAEALQLGPAEVATLRLRPSRRGEPDRTRLGPSAEPAQPVFTRYWLHNKGPAPMGNLPTAVHLSPRRLTPGDRLRLTVAASSVPAAGRIELLIPPGLIIAEPGAYDLGRNEYVAYDLDVDASRAAPGTYFVAARIRDHLGQVLEDAVTVEVGQVPSGDPVEVVVESTPPALRPGEEGEIVVGLRNRAASPVRGEAQLISPYGTWGQELLIGPWTRGFEAAPGEIVRMPFGVRAHAPGSWWALVKVAYFGRLYYTGTIGIDVVG
jgi:alpha-mannosidase